MRRKKVIIIKIDGTNIQEEPEDKKKKKRRKKLNIFGRQKHFLMIRH